MSVATSRDLYQPTVQHYQSGEFKSIIKFVYVFSIGNKEIHARYAFTQP
jgi:hypothetical protein